MAINVKRDAVFDLRSVDYKDLNKSFGSVPAELAGQWKLRNPGPGDSLGFRIFEDGKHYIALYPYTVTFTADSQSMTFNNVPFDRVTDESSGLNGLWRRNGATDQYWFFDSGCGYEIVGSSLIYMFTVDQNAGAADKIQLWPLRAIAVADVASIKFSPIYWTESASISYTLNTADELALDVGATAPLVYDRVPFGPLT